MARGLGIALAVLCAGGCKLSAGGGGDLPDAAGEVDASAPDAAAVCDPASCPSLSVVKSIGASGRDFATIGDWQQARRGNLITRSVMVVNARSGQFELGETVTSSSCSGLFVPDGGSEDGVLTLDELAGDCAPGDQLSGELSGATATYIGHQAVGTVEVGELHADGVFAEAVAIAGSVTDADHHMVLSVAESDRHAGVAGTGPVIDPPGVEHGVHIGDPFTVVEWVEVTDWHTDSTGSRDGINVQADQVLVQNVIVHDDGHGIEANSDAGGIQVASDGITVTVRNSIVYNIARMGIGIHEAAGATLNVENCTVLRCVEADSSPASYGCIAISGTSAPTSNAGAVLNVTNSIALDRGLGTAGVFRVGPDSSFGAASNNVSSDQSAPGADSALDALSAAQVVSTDRGSENLHLSAGSAALGGGVNLSSAFTIDIDGDSRPADPDAWDIGADQRGP